MTVDLSAAFGDIQVPPWGTPEVRKLSPDFPTGYAVSWSGNALPQLSRDDYPLRRARFARHHLWVTPYDPDELFSAGDYPDQSRGDDRLPTWTWEIGDS